MSYGEMFDRLMGLLLLVVVFVELFRWSGRTAQSNSFEALVVAMLAYIIWNIGVKRFLSDTNNDASA